VETLGRRARSIVAGAFAFATMLLPLGASGMDSTPGPAFDRPGNVLPLPPIPYLESMRWMNWKPEAPVFKTFPAIAGQYPAWPPAASVRA
jgi:hypothetical protein